VVEFPPPKPYDCDQYVFGWSSGTRLFVSGVLVIAGVLSVCFVNERALGWGFGFIALVAGEHLLARAFADRKRKRVLQAEVDRAIVEWDELVRACGRARGSGDSVARLLQGRGYEQFEVRRWIMREIDALVAAARDVPPGGVGRS
jgi:hypothetical protein